MEKQFTFKDFSLFAFLSVVFVTLLLAMYMVDRQWGKLAQIQRTLAGQADDLRALRSSVQSLDQRVRSGNVALGDERPFNQDMPSAFKRAYAMTQEHDYQTGDWVVRALGLNLETLTPLVSSDAYSSEVQSYVLESLLTRDPESLEWSGLIANDWQISEDGLVMTFQMRNDVNFSDGEPLEADDVVFTYDFIMNETIAAPRERAFYQKIKSVTATGPYEVIFTFKEPYFNSLSLAGGMSIMPRHFYEPYLEKPGIFNQSKGLLLGSGPYRLKDPVGWTPDQGLIELDRNPRYWGPVEPTFDRLVWSVIVNEAARLTTFRNGEIDVYSARPREYQTLLKDRNLMSQVQDYEYMSPRAGYRYVGWNQIRNGESTFFADKRVRQAMTYLTDKQRIIDEIYLGYGEPAISPFNPRSKQHDSALIVRDFDVSKAKQLLLEAGFDDRDGNGILEDKAGNPFVFELVFPQEKEDYRRKILFMKDLYARAGVVLIPKPTEWSVLLDMIKKRNFDAIAIGWSSSLETDIYQIFHSDQLVGGGDNFVGYKNEALDKLIEKARSTVDETERMKYWQAAERILYEDQPYTFLMRSKSLVFIDKRFKNLHITNMGLNFGFTPIESYVPVVMQKYGQH
jgi:peptide/nickel transport system substrate-binding protein